MDSKLLQLNQRTAPANTDQLYVVVPGDTDPDRRVSLELVGRFARAGGVVAFPAASDSPGNIGDIAHGIIDGVAYIALYTGDGDASHSWLFAAASTTRPSDPE